MRVNVGLEKCFSQSAANQATSAEAMPVGMATFQSTNPKPMYFEEAAAAVRMITASDVPTADFCCIPRISTNAGTMMIPPPTPHSAEITPVATPIPAHHANVVHSGT